jgi:uncharacterized protein YeaO (DUF488 family)
MNPEKIENLEANGWKVGDTESFLQVTAKDFELMANEIFHIRTSYFAKYKGDDGVSIALKTPEWFNQAAIYKALAPSWSILGNYQASLHTKENQEIYEKRYRTEILAKRNPIEVARDLNGMVLLCYEKSGEFCHRHIVAAWLYETLKINVVEVT